MIVEVDEVQLALGVGAVILLGEAVGSNAVVGAMDEADRAGVLASRVVDGQGAGRANILAAKASPRPQLYLGRRIDGVILLAEG